MSLESMNNIKHESYFSQLHNVLSCIPIPLVIIRISSLPCFNSEQCYTKFPGSGLVTMPCEKDNYPRHL
ncbi:hypothetical protein CDL12_24104 [Handroanthus impetiginosus]|uniref:Uncharacterized protein n=1 Tax=Handroanthus impetiginosus TaxID=429701 RepID=A0A2G9GDK3_9LAMI|nr:hypothetical protein CDL12_24104 [Handroanthus impetiginosus]